MNVHVGLSAYELILAPFPLANSQVVEWDWELKTEKQNGEMTKIKKKDNAKFFYMSGNFDWFHPTGVKVKICPKFSRSKPQTQWIKIVLVFAAESNFPQTWIFAISGLFVYEFREDSDARVL